MHSHSRDKFQAEYYAWSKTQVKTNYPKLFSPAAQLLNDDVIIFYSGTGKKPCLYSFTVSSSKFSEAIELVEEDSEEPGKYSFDPEMVHNECVIIHNGLFLLPYKPPEAHFHVLFVELSSLHSSHGKRSIYKILSSEHKPQHFRSSFSVALEKHGIEYSIYVFGGLSDRLVPLNTLEAFQVNTYQWEQIKTKGTPPSPRHSAQSFIFKRKLFLVGGKRECEFQLLPSNSSHICKDIWSLNLDSLSWSRVGTSSLPEEAIGCCFYGVRYDESQLLILSLAGSSCEMSNESKLFLLDLEKESGKELPVQSDNWEFRIGASVVYLPTVRKVVAYGGLRLGNEGGSPITNQVEKLLICTDKTLLGDASTLYINENKPKNSETGNATNSQSMASSSQNSNEKDIVATFEQLLEMEKKLQAEETGTLPIKKKKKKKKPVS